MDSTLLLPSQDVERCTNDERRASPRYPLPRPVQWTSLSAPVAKQLCLAHDISTLGIGLLLDRPLDISTFVDVDLLDSGARPIRSLLSRVVHVAPHLENHWLIGCAFITELSRNDLAPYQAEVQPAAGPQDHRRWTRFPCNVETACYTCETTPGETRSGRILNISAGGIGLLLRCSFTPGTLLFFELPGHPTRQILIRVVRLLEHGKGNWFLGCEFADQLREDELISLLSL